MLSYTITFLDFKRPKQREARTGPVTPALALPVLATTPPVPRRGNWAWVALSASLTAHIAGVAAISFVHDPAQAGRAHATEIAVIIESIPSERAVKNTATADTAPLTPPERPPEPPASETLPVPRAPEATAPAEPRQSDAPPPDYPAPTPKLKPAPAPPARPSATASLPQTPRRAHTAPPPPRSAPAAPNATPQGNAPELTPEWRAQLRLWLNQHKTYPEEARQRGEEGQAVARFTVMRDGMVTGVTLVHSTGSSSLDAAVLAMLRNARLSAFPPAMTQSQTTVTMQIRYALER
jgi:protein TonB